MSHRKTAVWIGIAAGISVAALIVFGIRHWRSRMSIIQGAVIRRNADLRKEVPISDVLITASKGNASITTHSDAAGYFSVAFPGPILPGQTVNLIFRHPDYKPLDLQVQIQFRSSLRRLVIATMAPIPATVTTTSDHPLVAVSNIRVRYTVNSPSDESIGSAVKLFQVVNRGNVPCHHQFPCSPDGYWKASTGSVKLDAGPGNEFRDARASCIAGPCPFTRIDSSGFVNGGRMIVASATDWSDTATFLVQAEVYHTTVVSMVRESYPVIFGRTLSFTLPPTAEGVSLEAELNGTQIVFPLGPNLYLNWADCAVRGGSSAKKSTVYQCELKPGFSF